MMKKIQSHFDIFFIECVKFLYNHCKWFNRFVRDRARRQGPINEILIELLCAKEPLDVDYWLDRISKINNHDT